MSTPQQPQGDPGQPYIPQGYELSKKKKPFYQRLGCIIPLAIVLILIVVIAVNTGGSDDSSSNNQVNDSGTSQDGGAVNEAPAEEAPAEDNIPAEFKSALRQSDSYANNMHMSQQGVYDQLTSEYGGQFPAEAAQYAVDNVEADWNENALEKAKSYQDNMAMSPSAIYDQLISEYGEKFTAAEADYAIANLNQ